MTAVAAGPTTWPTMLGPYWSYLWWYAVSIAVCASAVASPNVTLRSTPPARIVATAFTGEGLQVDDYVRPSAQLAAEHQHPDWNWASPSLTVHIVSGLAVDEIVRKVTVPIGLALASVRRKVSDLPVGVVIEAIDRRISLSLAHDDSPDDVAKAMSSLPVELEARATIGWDRERGIWFDL